MSKTALFEAPTPTELREARWKMEALAERYRTDASLRRRIDEGDTAEALAEIDIEAPPHAEVRFVADTDEVMHFTLPPDPNVDLADEALHEAGGSNSAGSAATVFTFGTTPSTASSASSVSSASSAG